MVRGRSEKKRPEGVRNEAGQPDIPKDIVARATAAICATDRALPPLSGVVLLLACLYGVLVTVTQYGYDLAGDEYFFLVAGKHLGWGYADQPPLVAFLAHLADTVMPGSRALLRLPMVIAVCVGIQMAALIAREFGGDRKSQLLAAVAFAVSPYALAHTRWLTTDAIDMACWATCIWLLVRWVRTRRDSLWWAIGAVTALGLQNKYLIGAFWIAVAVALLIVGPRLLLRRPVPFVAGLLAALTAIPSLMWQERNGWPQMDEGSAIVGDASALGGRLAFLPSVVVALGIAGTVLFCVGTWWLLRHGGDNRFLGVVIVALVLLVWLAQMRRNYLGGLYPLGIGIGAVQLERAWANRWWRWVASWPAVGASAVLLFLPVLVPVGYGWLGGIDRYLLPSHHNDWEGLSRAVGSVVQKVPESERRDTIVIGGDYWRASVLEWMRLQYDLPPVYGDMQGSWFFGPPSASTKTVVYVNTVPNALRKHCGHLVFSRWYVDDRVSPISNEQTRTPIFVCSHLDVPVTQLWTQLRHTELPRPMP